MMEGNELIKEERPVYPVIPLRGKVIFPNTFVNFDVGRPMSLNAVKAASDGDLKVFIAAQKNALVENPKKSRNDRACFPTWLRGQNGTSFFPLWKVSPCPHSLFHLSTKYGGIFWGKGEEFQLYRSLMLERMSLMTSLVSGSVLHCFSTRSMEWRMVV